MNFFIAQVEPACPEFHMFYYILPFAYFNPPLFLLLSVVVFLYENGFVPK